MKLKATIDGSEHEIDVKREGKDVEITVDGATKSYQVSEPEPGLLLFNTEKGTFEAFVDVNTGDGHYRVSVAGEDFEIGFFDPRKMRAEGPGTGTADGKIEIKSAMPGKVVRVLVSEGQEVVAGEGVVVVEAMKMQNELKSPKDGVIRQVLVAEDDRVNSGDVLAVIE